MIGSWNGSAGSASWLKTAHCGKALLAVYLTHAGGFGQCTWKLATCSPLSVAAPSCKAYPVAQVSLSAETSKSDVVVVSQHIGKARPDSGSSCGIVQLRVPLRYLPVPVSDYTPCIVIET
eukprot:COSAG05_NODE_2996_length_2424_cov_2.078280_1_plen_120_part_00